MTMKVTRRSQIPGSRFNPTNLELVNILGRKIDRDKRSSFVTELHNLYEKAPWLLQHVRHVRFKENEWFCFVTRKQLPGIKKADSNRPSRQVAGSGRWKTTGALTHIRDKDGVKVGSMQSINYKANSETEEDGITTGWLMHEFLLNKPGFQEVALCRIRFNPDEEYAQYAPRLEPMMIGLGREDGSSLVENNLQNHMISIHHGVAAADEEIQYLDAPVETHQDQRMEYQQIMGQDSNYPIFNGGMEQHQNFGSNGQILGHVSPMNGGMEQHQDFGSNGQILGHLSPMEHLGQGFEDIAGYQNQYLLGLETTDSGPSSANQCLGQDLVPMTECLMVHHQEQHSAAQHQQIMGQDSNYPIFNGGMEQHQDFGSCSQQQNQHQGMEQHYGQGFGDVAGYQNQYLLGQETMDARQVPMMMNQALNEWNEYSGPSSAHQYLGQDMVPMLTQGLMVHHQEQHLAAQHPHFSMNGSMEQHQDFGSSALCSAQNNHYLVIGELAAQQQYLGQDSNFSLPQHQNHILRQSTHLSPTEQQQFWGQNTDPSQIPIMMNQALELEEKHFVPYSAQPYLGQNIDLPTVPMEAQQQDNVVQNVAAQRQLEEKKATDLPMNQGIDEQSLGDETAITDQEMDSEMMANTRRRSCLNG